MKVFIAVFAYLRMEEFWPPREATMSGTGARHVDHVHANHGDDGGLPESVHAGGTGWWWDSSSQAKIGEYRNDVATVKFSAP